MKKIEFGFANEKNPTGSWQGTGINEEIGLTDAEYYGAIKFDGNSYIVAKVTEDKFGHWPNLVGRFIVRPAIADMYPDGSGIIFLDQEQSLRSSQIENFLNNEQIKDKISNLDDILNSIKGISKGDRSFDVCTMSDVCITTSIRHEVFEEKNNALKNCHQSFSDLQSDLITLRKNEPSKSFNTNRNVEVLDIPVKKANIQSSTYEPIKPITREEKEEIAVEPSITNNQPQQTPILDLAEKEKVAMQAKQVLSQITRTDFINEHRYDEKSIDELNKELVALQQEIYGLSDDMALAMAKSCDRVKLEEERKNAYSNTKFDKEPYHRDQYAELFNYLNSQISKEAENILLDDDKERELDLEEAKEVISEATNVLENANQEKKEFLSKTQELLEESQKILNQPELSPDYSIDQNLEGYVKLEQEINNNPNLSEKEKQDVRNALWYDFDNYVEHNPEQNKSR